VLRDVTKKSIGFIFGPNGVGKGTLADLVSEKFQYYHYNMGAVVREYADMRGHEDIKKLVDNGILVDDEFIHDTLLDKIEHLRYQNIVFDGVPRRNVQVSFMQEICDKHGFSPEWVIVLHAPMDVIMERLTERVMAPDGKVYHLRYNPPPAHYKPEELVTRPDDRPEVVQKRYEDYVTLSLECLSHPFFLDIPTFTIDATKSISEVCHQAELFLTDIHEN
jgi:adenylate kinase